MQLTLFTNPVPTPVLHLDSPLTLVLIVGPRMITPFHRLTEPKDRNDYACVQQVSFICTVYSSVKTITITITIQVVNRGYTNICIGRVICRRAIVSPPTGKYSCQDTRGIKFFRQIIVLFIPRISQDISRVCDKKNSHPVYNIGIIIV